MAQSLSLIGSLSLRSPPVTSPQPISRSNLPATYHALYAARFSQHFSHTK